MKSEYILAEIQKLKTPDVSYIDIIIEFAEKNGYELELMADIIRRSNILKAVIEDDAASLNMIERESKLSNDLFE